MNWHHIVLATHMNSIRMHHIKKPMHSISIILESNTKGDAHQKYWQCFLIIASLNQCNVMWCPTFLSQCNAIKALSDAIPIHYKVAKS
jgi:hypothetical protein